ncbi:hypothetical protein BJY00DRAFT_312931 [Aspergillus carlsbadensis]|nr:hypothetical protein BJY00DRAFT_312931 [Aspergillus carlsbadensis]
MGIRKLDWNNWIEMDSYFLRYHDLKASELKKDFDGHVKYVDRPSTKDACFELYEELARYLTHRYPRIFSLKDGVLRNSLAKEEFQYPATWATAKSKGLGINDLHFRSERQTLRRLPRPGAILFTIRTYFEPMTTIAREPHVPGRLAEAIRNWDAVVSAYKGKAHWEGILLPYLDERNAVQVREGVLGGSVEGAFPY